MDKKIAYLVVADKVIKDIAGKYSVIGIFDNVNIPHGHDDVQLPTFAIFLKVLNTKGTQNVKITIKHENGDVLNNPVVLSGEKPFESDALYVAAEIVNVNFNREGIYKVLIEIDGVEVPFQEQHVFTVIKQ